MIRSASRAIIIHNNSLLVIQYTDETGDWYLLPGGGQKTGETLVESIKRECFEELSLRVNVLSLRFVREFIARKHPPSHVPIDTHQVEHFFICECTDYSTLKNGHKADDLQKGFEWLPLANIGDYRLNPETLRCILSEGRLNTAEVYI